MTNMDSEASEEDRARRPRRKPPNDSNGHKHIDILPKMDPINGTSPPKMDPVNGKSENGLDSSKSACVYLINHEFRALQLDKQMAAMSVFDLIDHCATLFERSTLEKNNDAAEAFRLYVRSYLIFNYFVNTFIMLHFNGFAKFMESSPQDFIIYLNLYNFYRSDDILGPHAFSIPPQTVREWSLEYLTQKKLLSFDPDLLYDWLDEYVQYLKNKEGLEAVSGVNEEVQEDEQCSDDDAFEFTTRFPELSIDHEDFVESLPAVKSPNLRHSAVPIPAQNKAPYPVSNGVHTDTPLPYPLESERSFSSAENGVYTKRPPPPIPPPSVPPRVVGGPNHTFPYEVPLIPAKNGGNGAENGSYDGHYENTGTPVHHGSGPGHVGHRLMNAFVVPSSGHNRGQNGRTHNPNSNGGAHSHASSNGAYMGPVRSMLGPGHTNVGANPDMEVRRTHAICGLKNMGSSCYINSTVQVLIGLARFENLILKSQKKSTPQPLTDSTAGLITTFRANGGAHILPSKFLRTLAALKPDFRIPFQQQDAQEFLLFMLDRLHAEMAEKSRDDTVDYLRKWNISVNARDREDYLKWYRELLAHEGESAITDTFQGHVQSKLVCNQCGHRSVSYSPFTILSLPIPGGNRQTIDLTDCLRYYTQDEVLTGENAWNCPKCNKTAPKDNPMDTVFQPKRGLFRLKRSKSPPKKTSASVPASTSISIKQLSFIKLPPVMFVHLSRFSMFGVTDKLNTPISYPLRLKFNHSDHDIYYSLTGLINHFGSMKSGHYTSLVNKAKGGGDKDTLVDPFWCIFDDEVVHLNVRHGNVNSSEHNKLHSQDVYVLCYERV